MSRFEFYGPGLRQSKPRRAEGQADRRRRRRRRRALDAHRLLKEWFENTGHAVLDTGMTRSALAGKGLKAAKEGNTLGRIAMSLFYATDFADRLENEIIPALARRIRRPDGSLHLLAHGPRDRPRRRPAVDQAASTNSR